MTRRPGGLLARQRALLPASRLTLGLLLKPRAGALPHRFARLLRRSSMHIAAGDTSDEDDPKPASPGADMLARLQEAERNLGAMQAEMQGATDD